MYAKAYALLCFYDVIYKPNVSKRKARLISFSVVCRKAVRSYWLGSAHDSQLKHRRRRRRRTKAKKQNKTCWAIESSSQRHSDAIAHNFFINKQRHFTASGDNAVCSKHTFSIRLDKLCGEAVKKLSLCGYLWIQNFLRNLHKKRVR